MRHLLALIALALLVAGCAPATRVTLLPQPDGSASAVEVSARQSNVVLSKPYESAVVGSNAVDTEQLDAKSVQERYNRLLMVQPGQPERFTLYFEPGTSNLTPESTSELAEVLSKAIARAGGEIVVVGHTDRVGTVESNDTLSLRRAQAVRELVIQRGFDALRVDAIGRGEREPVVPTADEVAEPKNRRVEIIVR